MECKRLLPPHWPKLLSEDPKGKQTENPVKVKSLALISLKKIIQDSAENPDDYPDNFWSNEISALHPDEIRRAGINRFEVGGLVAREYFDSQCERIIGISNYLPKTINEIRFTRSINPKLELSDRPLIYWLQEAKEYGGSVSPDTAAENISNILKANLADPNAILNRDFILDKRRRTPLFYAIFYKNDRATTVLSPLTKVELMTGQDISYRDPLYHAVRHAYYHGIRCLLDNGANPNDVVATYSFNGHEKTKRTYLSVAVDRADPKIVDMLLRAGALPDAKTNNETPGEQAKSIREKLLLESTDPGVGKRADTFEEIIQLISQEQLRQYQTLCYTYHLCVNALSEIDARRSRQ